MISNVRLGASGFSWCYFYDVVFIIFFPQFIILSNFFDHIADMYVDFGDIDI